MTVEQKRVRPLCESPLVIFSVCATVSVLIGVLPHLWMNHQSWAFVVAGTLVIALGLTVALAPGRKG
ncbi:hypothetical protein Lesp02_24860 [Lentzea sp. NBRC 105346]|uniref:hypothetical protein n=1 Tax=Lentzea sp. NBRC 105346 TaxID=3032205 RepID=UPI002556F8E0|nr:hypothetical protein [Lentzea sp. NBRC 105346]GLZ30296.1 hypothetical protein Lesp02_24860 [Lentzea sp. NBRC 105346]